MILKDIINDLEGSSHPVAKALYKGDHSRVLAIGFKKGMHMKEHQASLSSRLFVLRGRIIYRQAETSTLLSANDEIGIPVNALHSIDALEDSLCLLVQG